VTPGERFDVAVVGGGTAGIAAAVAAARRGARTVLVERSDVLGGNAGNALVHTICGLFLNDCDTPQWANPGLPREIAERLMARGAAAAPERAGRVFVLPTYPHRMRRALLDLCRETAGLTVRMEAALDQAVVGQDCCELSLREADGRSTVRGKLAIDASGDANLAHALGAEVEAEPASRLQTPSLIVRLRGVEPDETKGFGRLRLSTAVARAEQRRQLPEGAGSVLVRPGARPGDAYLTVNIPRPPQDEMPVDLEARLRLTENARALAERVVEFLRAERPGFRDCEVVEWPRLIGVRETRRVVGRERLESADIVEGRTRADAVARSTWPIEIWSDHRGARFEYPSAPSSIPLGALVSRSHARLGSAGRCMSASHEALGALRVIGTALATGEAIGNAAAAAADAGATLAAAVDRSE